MKPIRHIVIDCNEANVSHRVGSNVYAYELLVAMHAELRSRQDIRVTVVHAQPLETDMPARRTNWIYEQLTPSKLWTQWALPRYLYQHRQEIDVYFSPGHYTPLICPVPMVCTIMDLAFLTYPNQFKRRDYLQLSSWTRASIHQAAHIIAISMYTKAEIHRVYGIPNNDISVAYPAAGEKQRLPTQKIQTSVLKKMGVTAPYFLFVGTIQPRKNIEGLITAFEIYTDLKEQEASQTQLVIAGKTGWLAEPILERMKHSPLRSHIIVTGYVSEVEKAILYRNALATVLPGLQEGFGIPPLEAMMYGGLAIVSNTSSLPEVVGDAGITVDPTNPSAVASALSDAEMIMNAQPKKQAAKSMQQASRFDWKYSARSVLAVLEKTAGRS